AKAAGMPAHEGEAGMKTVLMAVAILMGLSGIFTAWFFYVKFPGIPASIAGSLKGAWKVSYNKFYFDELYDMVFVRASINFVKALWRGFDVLVIDGMVNGVATVLQATGRTSRLLQSGQLQHYALVMALGIFIIVSAYLFF
ncbi:MAG TPA: NADH-quinone oxidoreductase subunit L, partial [Nitrospiria bacterium]|nr:NADH-quinone oxidoreductase subunit L [Nitrospiria bacterium]